VVKPRRLGTSSHSVLRKRCPRKSQGGLATPIIFKLVVGLIPSYSALKLSSNHPTLHIHQPMLFIYVIDPDLSRRLLTSPTLSNNTEQYTSYLKSIRPKLNEKKHKQGWLLRVERTFRHSVFFSVNFHPLSTGCSNRDIGGTLCAAW
jgi:hypothetical protein